MTEVGLFASPWLRIWRKPSVYSSELINSYSVRNLLLVLPIYAAAQGLRTLISSLLNQDSQLLVPFLRSIGVNLALHALGLIVWSYLFYLAGGMLKGEGSINRIWRAYLISTALSLPLITFFFLSVFISSWMWPIFNILYLFGSYWLLVINLHVQAEAHHFSVGKAIGSNLLSLLLLIPFICLGGGLYLIVR